MFRLLSSSKFVFFIVIVLILLVFYFSFLSRNAEPDSNHSHLNTETVQPVIDLETILATNDVEQALLESAIADSAQGLVNWQDRILDVAFEAGVQEKDVAHLQGQQGIEYLLFRGQRLLFDREVQQAYRSGESAQRVFSRFPQASDLFAQTEQLFAQRDQIIDSIAVTLQQSSKNSSEGELTIQQAKRAALQIWRERNGIELNG